MFDSFGLEFVAPTAPFRRNGAVPILEVFKARTPQADVFVPSRLYRESRNILFGNKEPMNDRQMFR
jgi:hypothetical protein